MNFKVLDTIYENPLSCEADVEGFIKEGEVGVTFSNGKMVLKNKLDPALGQKSNYLFWCPVEFPDCIKIEWDFKPTSDPGLAMMFFAAKGRDGKDLFDESLEKRIGVYDQYHSGDINAFHASYFRRKAVAERAFTVCNLRKSKGFYMVAQGADPIPDPKDVIDPYHVWIIKHKEHVVFGINDLKLYHFIDDGTTYGEILSGGRIGFRQMAPLLAEYSGLKVSRVVMED